MKKWMAVVVTTVLAVSLSACGGSGDGSQSGGSAVQTTEENARPLNIVATNYSFDQQEYRVQAGEAVEFSIENAEGIHAYEIKGLGITINAGDTKQYTIDTPGEYKIVCSIYCGTGHNDMKSKLIVE